MIRAGWASVADLAMAPMQDLLDLGSEARMNFPSYEAGNWGWRMSEDALSESLRARVAEINFLYGRRKTATADR
jgi:4-alpha-glucanotransferase